MIYLLLVMLFIEIAFIIIVIGGRVFSAKPAERLEKYFNFEKNIGVISAGSRSRGLRGMLKFLDKGVKKTRLLKKYSQGLEDKLSKADIPLTAEELLLLIAATEIFAAAALLILVKNLLLVILAMLVIYILFMQFISGKAAKRLLTMNEQLADALDLISGSLRTGYSFLKAMEISSAEMPMPISKEFKKVLKEADMGLPLETALENLLARFPSSDMELAVTAVVIQRKVGGNLAEVLDNISDTIRSRLQINREIRTLTAQGRISCLIVALIPVFLVIVLLFLDPGYLRVLTGSKLGFVMIGLAVFNEVLGFMIIRKMLEVNY